jgi:hypothetical protein
MKFVSSILAVMALGCGSSRPTTSAPTSTLAPGQATDCAGACERFATCWTKQYGQADASGDRAECEARCAKKPEAEQQAYVSRTAAETSCVKILDDL